MNQRTEYFHLVRLSDFGVEDENILGYFDPDTSTILYDEEIPSYKNKTYHYMGLLGRDDIDYAELYCEGRDPSSFFSENPALNNALYEQHINITREIKKFLRVYKNVQNKRELLISNIIPNKLFSLYYGIKNSITRYIFENYNKPRNYNILKQYKTFLLELKERPLKLDKFKAVRHFYIDGASRQLRDVIKRGDVSYVDYNLFGTVTGRLTHTKGSFPIQTLNKKYRDVIKPNNDVFIEFDYRGADVTTFLYIFDEENSEFYSQYSDIYQFFKEKYFQDIKSRKEIKVKTMSLLYDKKDNYFLSNMPINKILSGMSLRGNDTDIAIVNPYGRSVKLSGEKNILRNKKISYLIQSTTNDNMLTSVLKIDQYLKTHKLRSRIAFTLHDSLTIDFNFEELQGHLSSVLELFESTLVGKYGVNVSMGKNYGEMENIGDD